MPAARCSASRSPNSFSILSKIKKTYLGKTDKPKIIGKTHNGLFKPTMAQ